MNTLLHDLKFSFRMLAKSPLFTAIAVLTLMLGIGLNAATFSAVNGLLLKPLSGASETNRLVQLYRHWPGIEYGSNSIPHYQDLRDRSTDVFEQVSAWFFAAVSLKAEGQSERLIGVVVSANFFQTYGVQPELGRWFLPGIEDRDPGAHPVAVLGHGFWQDRFGGDRDILGQTIDINGAPFEVVGVAPKDFRGPMSVADVPLYVPLMMQPHITPGRNRMEQRGNNNMTVVARLADGVSMAQAGDALEGVLAQLREDYPDSYEGQLGTTMVAQNDAGLHPSFGSAQSAMSAVMMVVVGLLLLIACVNVANLFLARARERQREISIRLSLGAKRRRILQQLLTESLVFSMIAGAASLAVASIATRLLASVKMPVDGPFAFDVGLDERVLWFTLALSVLTGLVFGSVPALQAASSRMSLTTTRGSTIHRTRLSRGLVVVQIALSLVLLVSSGLFLRSLQSATQLDPGFASPNHLVMASIDPGLQGYDQARAATLFDSLQEQLAARPEVSAVGLTNSVPLGLGNSDRYVEVPGYEFAEGERRSMHYSYISVGYLEAMGIDLLEGRTFAKSDTADAQPVMVVNQRFADRFWPQESAVGRTVTTADQDHLVIGVVKTGKYQSLGEQPTEFMYFPHQQRFDFSMTVVARSQGSADGALTALRSTIRSLDADLPVFDVRTMEDHMGIALLPARLGGSVLGFFGVLGLALAAVGVYGVMAYSVSQRQRELGIRLAMGADRRGVTRLVLGEGLKLAVAGAVLGLIGAVGAAKLVENLLYNMSALDPATFAAVPIILLAVAAAAVYLPARRAARTDPMNVLRQE